MINTKSILQETLTQAKNDLVSSYRSKGLNASGESENLTIDIDSNGYTVNGRISGPIQWYFMENGRQPNKDKSRGQIGFLYGILKRWAEQKGVKINAWMAARKIVYEGIKVPNRHNPGGVISDVINDEFISRLNDKLNAAVVSEYKSIIKSWQ